MFVVIMAGGSGTRFWPASREKLPKQFLAITGNRTMLEETLARAGLVAGADRTYVVVNALHEEVTNNLLGDAGPSVLVEPTGRNTTACIGLAAMHIARSHPDEPVLVLPADHHVTDPNVFARELEAAAQIALSGAIVTLGVRPTRPETGYGYIEAGRQCGRVFEKEFFRVERFVEKPDRQTAAEYVSSGRFYWNSGIFGFTASTILAEIQRCAPGIHQGLVEIGRTIGTSEYDQTIKRIYPTLDSISIDYAVMEKTAAELYVLPAGFGWSDVGSWQAVFELNTAASDPQENLAPAGTLVVDARKNLVYSTGGRVIALLGVEGLAIIDAPDALLVVSLDRSQEVKQFPELLKRLGRAEIC